MKLSLIPTLLAALTLLFVSCSDDTTFNIEGSFADGGEHELDITYFNGAFMQHATVPTVKGEFRYIGSSSSPAVVTLSEQGRKTLVMLIATNGDDISVKLDSSEPLNSKVSGSKASEALNEFVIDNAAVIIKDDAAAINAAIGDYIGRNPDSPVSTALLTYFYRISDNEERADSLLRLLGPKARSRAILGSFPSFLSTQISVEATAPVNSISLPGPDGHNFYVYPRESSLTLYAFADDEINSPGVDSSLVVLRDLTPRFPRKRLRAVLVSSAMDSLSWASKVKNDSTSLWDKTWSPVVVAQRQWRGYTIPQRPYFILVDSTGTQRLRTASGARLIDFVNKFLTR